LTTKTASSSGVVVAIQTRSMASRFFRGLVEDLRRRPLLHDLARPHGAGAVVRARQANDQLVRGPHRRRVVMNSSGEPVGDEPAVLEGDELARVQSASTGRS
jgi:hypothetical protein